MKKIVKIFYRTILPWKNLSRKNQKRLSFAAFVLILILIPLSVYVLEHAKGTEAAWFNTNWSYRQRIDITNSGSAQTDFQVSFTLNTATPITAGKMRSDCNDIRVTDVAGKLLPYWIESNNGGCNNSSTIIWTKVPIIGTTGNTLYIYYGNPQAASYQNGENVFQFFDDFNDSALGKWTQGSSGTGGISVSGGYAELKYASSTDAIMYANFNGTPTETIEFRGIQIMQSPSYRNRINIGSYSGGTWSTYTPSGDYGLFYDGAVAPAEVYFAGFTNNNLNTTDKFNIKYNVIGTNDVDAYYTNRTTGASLYTNTSATWDQGSNTVSAIRLAATEASGSDFKIDTVWVRKYASTEPTIAAPTNEENGPGPIAYWKFNEGAGTTTTDSSSNNMIGTFGATTAAPTWKTKDMCISGNCIYFDGGDNISVPANAAINFTESTPFTVSGWVRLSTTGATQYIINKQENTTNEFDYSLRVSSSNNAVFALAKQNVSEQTATGGTTLQANKWYYLTGVFDGSTGLSVYVNGLLDGTGTRTFTSSTQSVASLYFGEQYNGSNYLTGFIDEPKIYKYARSASQIKVDFNKYANVLGAVPDQNLSNGLTGYWKMDETATPSLDSSGDGNSGTWTGTVTSATGKFGNAVSTDGSNSNYVSVADSSSLNPTNAVTVSLWVYRANSTNVSSGGILCKGNGNSSEDYCLDFPNTNSLIPRFFVRSGGTATTLTANTAVASAGWSLITGVFDGKNLYIYINGALDNSTPGPSTIDSNNHVLSINCRQTGSTTYDRCLNERVDEVRIYNRALSPAEVAQLYNFAPGPVAYYNFEEKQGTTVNDTSGNGNGASFTGSPSWIQGKYGAGVSTDNTTSDYVNAPNVDLPAGDWTAMAWFKYPLSSTGATYWTLFRGNGGDHQIIVRRSDNLLGMYDNSGGNFRSCGFTMTALSSTWHHIAAVGTGSVENFYIDGVYTCQSDTKSTTDIKAIGNYQGGSQNWGKFDEVKIYNYARTAGQIVEDMNASHPAPGSPVGSPLAYMKLDDGFGNVASNSGSVATLSAGLYNMASPATGNSGWTNNGKFGKALVFDGVNDYVRFANNSQLGFTGNITLSAWIKAGSLPSSGNTATIIEKGYDGTNEGYYLKLLNPSGTPQVYCGSYNGSDHAAIWNHNLSAQVWYQLMCTYDGSNWNIYVNGVLKKSTADATGAINSTKYTMIGATDLNGTVSRFFDGTIDEVKIFNSALTASQVKLEYNHGQSLVLGAFSDTSGLTGGSVASNSASAEYCIPGDTTSCAAPVARWDFEEGKSTAVNDTSGNSNAGTFQGTATSIWTQGKIGKGGNFNGTDNYVSTTTSYVNPQDFTVSAWFKTTVASGHKIIGLEDAQTGTGSTSYDRQIYMGTDGKIYFAWYSGVLNTITSITTLNDGKWHYAVGTHTSGNVGALYIDGVLQGTGSNAAQVFTGYWRIGSYKLAAWTNASDGYFTGQIDGVRIFNYARSAAQVAWDYNNGKPVGYWKFDECQGATANDSSGNGNSGTITIGAGAGTGHVDSIGTCSTASTAWGNGVNGKYNYSLSFDGIDDYASISYNKSLYGTEITSSAWIYPTSVPQAGNIVSADGNTAWRYRINTNQTITFFDRGATNAITTTETVPLNQWSHVAVVGSAGGLKIYINGHLSKSNGVAYGAGDPGSGAVVIGAYNAATQTEDFTGRIDDVKIYNYALTKQQIQMIYNQGSAIRYGPLTGAP